MATGETVAHCSWCDKPSVPDPAAHPDGQAEHVYVGDRPATTVRVSTNVTAPPSIIFTAYAMSTVVESAPEETRVSLDLIGARDPQLLFVRGDKIFVGNDRAGNEVVYRVVGWDAEETALIVRRES